MTADAEPTREEYTKILDLSVSLYEQGYCALDVIDFVHAYPNMLGPTDAAAFFSLGTNCASFAQPPSDVKGSEVTLFGYTYTFGVKDASGKQVSNYSF